MNKNFEVTSWQNFGENIVLDIRVLDKEYRYFLKNADWVKKIVRKPWFTAKDLEKVEEAALEYKRLS